MHASAWNNKGYALFNQGKDDEAEKCFDKALEIDPENMDALLNKGGALGGQGKYEDMIRFSEKYLEIAKSKEIE